MTTNTSTRLICLGQISRVHGVRGDLIVRSYTATPEAIADYGPLTNKSADRQFKLRVLRATDKGVVVHVDGIDDRSSAEALRGTDLYVARHLLPPASEDEFYHADLIGLTVVDADGAALGRIAAIQNFGAGDLIEVSVTRATSADSTRRDSDRGDSLLVPFTKACVPSIDFDAARVTIVPPVMVGDPEPGAADDDTDDHDGVASA